VVPSEAFEGLEDVDSPRLAHDPEDQCARKEHLIKVGRRIRLKRNIGPLI